MEQVPQMLPAYQLFTKAEAAARLSIALETMDKVLTEERLYGVVAVAVAEDMT